VLKRLAKGARRWIAITEGVPGQGRRLFDLVAQRDLEGIVAKRLADRYAPGRAMWFKILNGSCSQKEGRSDLFAR
jgi:ATP-dependent DNA ligase